MEEPGPWDGGLLPPANLYGEDGGDEEGRDQGYPYEDGVVKTLGQRRQIRGVPHFGVLKGLLRIGKEETYPEGFPTEGFQSFQSIFRGGHT